MLRFCNEDAKSWKNVLAALKLKLDIKPLYETSEERHKNTEKVATQARRTKGGQDLVHPDFFRQVIQLQSREQDYEGKSLDVNSLISEDNLYL